MVGRAYVAIGGLLQLCVWLNCNQCIGYQPLPTHLKGLVRVRASVFVYPDVVDAARMETRLTQGVARLLATKARLLVVDDRNEPLFRLDVSVGHLDCSGNRVLLVKTRVDLLERVVLARDPSLAVWESGSVATWSSSRWQIVTTTSAAEEEVDRQVNELMDLFCQAVVDMNKGGDPAAQTQR